MQPALYQIVLSTCSGTEEAERIARDLVENGVAACVNIVPGLRSLYRWQGRLETANEALMIIKATADKYPAIESRIKRLHSYDMPEVLALPISQGAAEYLRGLGPPPMLDQGE